MSVYALNLLRALVEAGHDVTMVSQYRDDAFGRGVYGGGPPPDVPGVRVIGLEQKGEAESGDFERDIDEIVATIAAEHARRPFDLLHAQYGYPTGWAALLASRALGVPSVVSIQGGDGHWVGSCCETHRLAMTRVLDHAGAVLIGCRSFADEVTGRLGTDPKRFTIVPGAVDTGRFMPDPAPRDPDAPPVLLYHGRVDRRKGVLDMIEALTVLRDEGLAFRLVVSGIGPDLDETARRLAATRLDALTTMRGYVDYDHAPEAYAGADIFVSPTYAEGFSNTILEAMATGLATISCRVVGVVDCLRDGENGLLTEPGDIAALASGLRRLITDRSLRDRLAATALEECRRVYSWQAVAGQIMRVYAVVVGRPPDTGFETVLPRDPCRFRSSPHLL
jgi:glycogen(starch) synthase